MYFISFIKGGVTLGKIIAVANQKGGVGKTTTTVNLAAGLGILGKKTLIVDVDPQGNATSGVGIDRRQANYTTYTIILDESKGAEAVKHTDFINLDIIPSSLHGRAWRVHRVTIFFADQAVKN